MILMYHKVYLNSPTRWWVDIDNFYRHLCDLQEYDVVYLDDYDFNNPRHVVITFDDGYSNVSQFAAPLLKKFSYPFEVFINGAYLGKYNSFDSGDEPKTKIASRDELKKVVAAGGRLQWHSFDHIDMSKLTDKRVMTRELSVPAGIKKLDKKGFGWVAYPYGKFNQEVKARAKLEFRGALSCNQGTSKDIYCLNRVEITNESSFRKNKISVVIPCYNHGHYLVEAVESVLRQTVPVDAIFIADDCSTDNTKEIAKNYLSRYPKIIRYFRNKRRLGIPQNHNKAVKKINSGYVCILDADNYFNSDYIERTARELNLDSRVGIAYTDYALFGPLAQAKYEKFPASWKGEIKMGQNFIINFPNFNEESRNFLSERNFIHGNSLYRKEAYSQVGGYKVDSKRPEDHSLFYRIVKTGWLAKRVPYPLLYYRQHSKDQENDRFNFFAELNFYKVRNKEIERILKNYRDIEDELNRIKSSFLWTLLYAYKNPKQGVPVLAKKIISKLTKHHE